MRKIGNFGFIGLFLLLSGVLIALESHQETGPQDGNVKPAGGLIPDSITAIKIAEALLVPIFGEEGAKGYKPLNAHLVRDSIWAISGHMSPGRFGNVYLEIQRYDCKVVYFSAIK